MGRSLAESLLNMVEEEEEEDEEYCGEVIGSCGSDGFAGATIDRFGGKKRSKRAQVSVVKEENSEKIKQ